MARINLGGGPNTEKGLAEVYCDGVAGIPRAVVAPTFTCDSWARWWTSYLSCPSQCGPRASVLRSSRSALHTRQAHPWVGVRLASAHGPYYGYDDHGGGDDDDGSRCGCRLRWLAVRPSCYRSPRGALRRSRPVFARGRNWRGRSYGSSYSYEPGRPHAPSSPRQLRAGVPVAPW